VPQKRGGLTAAGRRRLGRCRKIMVQGNVGLVFCERSLKDGGYRELLVAATCESTRRKVRIVLMSSVINSEEYRSAKRFGLFEVIAAPCRPTDVEWMVIRETLLQEGRPFISCWKTEEIPT
jgi:hypothetical protein